MITKKTIMRTQSQAGLSFAERKNFRPQVKNKLLLLLVLLLTAATSAWADVTWSFSDGTLTISGTGAMEDYTKASNHPWYTHKTNITSIVVEDGVTHIGNYAFQVYTNVTSISLPTSLTSIGNNAFQGCSNAALTSITIPENVTSIGDYAFQACSSLTTVTIPDKVTTIGNSAFSSCTGLTSVDIPNSVETIGQMAFRACTGLTSVTIGNSVTSIGNNVFNACSSLTTVTVKAPSCTLGTTAFDGCTSLTAIYVPSGKVDTYKGAENWSNYATYIQGDPDDEPAGPTSYNVTMKDGVKDADKWTVKVGEGQAQALPIGGLKGDGSETVTLQYNGRLKVKGVKATSDAAPAPAAKTLAEATSEDIGKIAGKDGKIYATKADAEAVATGNAVAMIAYIGTASDCTHGLAIALADESGTKNYGAAGTACSGKAAVTGGTWRLPSIKDWQYMFIGCGASGSYSDNPTSMSYSGLASKLTTAQGDALQTGNYWSSTEDNPGDLAWYVYFDGSTANFSYEDESNEYQVRACLAF